MKTNTNRKKMQQEVKRKEGGTQKETKWLIPSHSSSKHVHWKSNAFVSGKGRNG